MLLRWLIRSLCRTPAELRVVLMNLRAYRLRRRRPDYKRAVQWKFDRRITRNVRLSLLTGLLIVHVDSPQVFAAGWIALPLAALLALVRVAGGLR